MKMRKRKDKESLETTWMNIILNLELKHCYKNIKRRRWKDSKKTKGLKMKSYRIKCKSHLIERKILNIQASTHKKHLES